MKIPHSYPLMGAVMYKESLLIPIARAIHLLGPVGAIHLAPLLFRQFLEKIVIFSHFSSKTNILGFVLYDFSNIFCFRRCLSKMGQNWSVIGRGWSQGGPGHFWDTFGTICFSKNLEQIMKRRHVSKPILFWKYGSNLN